MSGEGRITAQGRRATMKVMLIFPPQWTPAMPHLALPVLTSALRSHGIEVIQRDLNLETYETVLSRAFLEHSLDRLRANEGIGGRGRGAGRDRAAFERLRWALEEGPRLAAQIEEAVAVFRSPAFYDGERSLAAFLCIAGALELASLPTFPARFDLLSYEPASSVDGSRQLLEAVRDAEHNLFLDVFRRGALIPDIIREQPDIVGISVPTRAQMLAAATVAHLIKQAGLPCHITAGGPHITMLREKLPQAPEIFDLFDSAMVFEGATAGGTEGKRKKEEGRWRRSTLAVAPAVRLVEALGGGGGLAGVPDLIWRAGSQVRVNGRAAGGGSESQDPERRGDPGTNAVGATLRGRPDAWSPDAEAGPADGKFPVPDFDGLPLSRYLAPDLVLPLITAHGCYHGRCAFCNVGYGAGQGFHALPVEQVLAQIAALRAKYGVRHIFFADEAIPPRTLRLMSEGLAAQGAPVAWCGCARLEPGLTEELLASMAAGGCRMLLFGLETASERIIQHMVKGTRRETMSRVLHASARAGIWNHTFFFFGFPTETMQDAQETVNFLYAHQDVLHSASPGVFVLERYSPVHVDPARFGVRRVDDPPDQDLAIYFDYEPESGLDEGMARTVVDRLVDALPAKRYGQYYLHDVYRFLYASHLRAGDGSFPLWLADEAAT